MKHSFPKRLVAIAMTLCMSVSLVPLSTLSASAAISTTSLDSWATNTLYTRGLSIAGKIVNSLGEATGDATVQQITSFINTTVCGNSDTAATDKIQETCDKILNTVDNMNDVINDINKNVKEGKMEDSFKEYSNAWTSQVIKVITANDTQATFYNVYDKYLDYLAYASGSKEIPAGKTLKDYEMAYVGELESYYACINNDYHKDSHLLNTDDYYQNKMFTSDAIDRNISAIITSMLYNMNPDKNTLGCEKNLGNRLIDKAAQYAFYAYRFSGEQAAFIDKTVEAQVDMVTTMLMIYQDFIARRAEYYSGLNHVYCTFLVNDMKVNRDSLSDEDKAIYDKIENIKRIADNDSNKNSQYSAAIADIRENYGTIDKCNKLFNNYYDKEGSIVDYAGLLDNYKAMMEAYLNGNIYLADVKASTKLEKYSREDAVSGTYTLKNNKFYGSLKYYQSLYPNDENKVRDASINGTKMVERKGYELTHGNTSVYGGGCVCSSYHDKNAMSVYKNVSVKAENGQLVFTPFYVLNGKDYNLTMNLLNVTKKRDNGDLFMHPFNGHYLKDEHYNWVCGDYTDGINKYKAIGNLDDLKALINETYYTVNNCNPSSYFEPYMDYTKDKGNYLLLNSDCSVYDPYLGVKYISFPAFNMKTSSGNAYCNKWSSEMLCYKDKAFKNSMYSVIYVPKTNNSATKVTVDTTIDCDGKVTVSNGKPDAGSKVNVTINVPESRKIAKVTAQYHNDYADPKKITGEKVLSEGVNSNELTFDYNVPYQNTTIAVETKDTSCDLDTYVEGEGTITLSNNNPYNENVKITVDAPEGYVITSVKLLHYNNSILSKSEDLYGNTNSNHFELEHYFGSNENMRIVATTEKVQEKPEDIRTLKTDENGNYLLNACSDFEIMAEMVNSGYSAYANGKYILTDDIYCYDSECLLTKPIGTKVNPFKGTFDGGNHVIKNVKYCPDNSYNYEDIGLFGVISGGSVKNLKMSVLGCNTENALALWGIKTAGGLCGYIENGTISNCILVGNLDGISAENVGGMAGVIGKGTKIENCFMNMLYGGTPQEFTNVNYSEDGIIDSCARMDMLKVEDFDVFDCSMLKDLMS